MFEIFEDENSEFYTPKRLLLVDGSYSMYRAYYGYNAETFKTKSGQPNNCIFGVAKQMITLIKQEAPTHIAVAYDLGRAGHRVEALPQYKQGRAETPDELKDQFPLVKEMLKLANIPVLEQERLEADDIIATLATKADQNKFETRIFSSDKDMHQLITERTKILRPKHAAFGFDLIDVDALKKKYGLTPSQYADFAALVGESADNIPGVPGVGPKTASAWLEKYGSLEKILENHAEINGKIGDALKNNIEQVKLNREINHLIRDADLSHSLEDLKIKSPNTNELNAFFEKWETPSLFNKMKWSSATV